MSSLYSACCPHHWGLYSYDSSAQLAIIVHKRTLNRSNQMNDDQVIVMY